MKKFFLIFLIFLSAFFCLNKSNVSIAQSPNTEYLRIVKEDAIFFQDELLTIPMFILPYTYYVKVLELKEDFAHVELTPDLAPAIDGYVLLSDTFSDGLDVQSPYPSISLTTLDTLTLYSDLQNQVADRIVFKGRNMFYYGRYIFDNENYLCVYYNGKLGYALESKVSPFTIENHPNELTFIKKPEPQTEKEVSHLELRILIIVFLSFAGITALVITFKHRPKRRRNLSYFEETEEE